MRRTKIVKILLSTVFIVSGHSAYGADTAIATLEISGVVPAVFSLSSRGLPGDLDLSPGTVVNDRLIGLLHFKYNQNVDSITFASDTASGVPENAAGDAYAFGAPFTVSVAGCSSITGLTNQALTAVGANYASAASGALVTGVIEDCSLTASWGGAATSLPLAGVYSMSITVTMVSL